MGLDMFLNRKVFVWGDTRKNMRIEGCPDILDASKINHITEEIAYWRKANQIHDWFVRNVQDGKDDCGHYNVDRDEIEILVNLCKQVLAFPGKAHELLPTKGGFFFGDTGYGSGYWEDIQQTIDQLEPILAIKNDPGEYEYHSSW